MIERWGMVEKAKRSDGVERFEIHLGGAVYILSLERGEKMARWILSLLDIDVAQFEAVMEATNPWIATMAIPNGYDCHYCRGFIRYVGVPRREMKEGHQEDCVFLKALKAGEVGG